MATAEKAEYPLLCTMEPDDDPDDDDAGGAGGDNEDKTNR